jgi:hypothetical protein
MALNWRLTGGPLSLTIGDEAKIKNRLEFTVTIDKQPTTDRAFLKLRLPVGEDGVLKSLPDANDIEVSATLSGEEKRGERIEHEDKLNYSVGLWDYKKGLPLQKEIVLEVKVTNILCNASMTKASIEVTAAVGKQKASATLDVNKRKPMQGDPILYFEADPSFLVGSEEVTLNWALIDDRAVDLTGTKAGLVQNATSGCKFVVDATTTYTLKEQGGHSKRPVTVTVLAKGWHSLSDPAPGVNHTFPSVIFATDNAQDKALYAIFMQYGPEDPRAFKGHALYKSENGIDGWSIVNNSIPQGMESSPGVRLGNRLWLIGGSAADPDLKSKRISCFDLNTSVWDEEVKFTNFENFEERMGHACVIVNRKIWVLGGIGRYEALNDVWELDPETKRATLLLKSESKISNKDRWKPRCLFSAGKFWDDEVWLCGGFDLPNGEPAGAFWRSRDGKVWEKVPPEKPPGKVIEGLESAIGTGFARSGGESLVIFTAPTESGYKPLASKLTVLTQTETRWEASSQIPDVGTEWSVWPHSISAVSFRGRVYVRFLHRDAMQAGHRGPLPPLYVYVPR